MRKESNEVANTLVLIVQIGVTMLVPILMCSIGGAWLDHKFQTRWIGVLGFILGTIAGFQNVYRLVRKEEQERISHDKSIEETK